jgi:hypothetical protein
VVVASVAKIDLAVEGTEEVENKPHRATTTSRSVSMISPDYNPNPEIDARTRW